MKFNNGFDDYLNYLRQKGYTKHTINEHKRFLYGALGHAEVVADKEIKDLKLTDVGTVIEAGKRHGEFGSQRAVVTLRRFLKFLKESGVKLPFDWRDIEVPRVPDKPVEWLPENELKRLLNSFNLNTITGLRTRVLLEVLYSTGMRIGEALSLDVKDIDFQEKEVMVKGKGGQIEKVYFTKRSVDWIKRYLRKRKGNHPALFVNESGKGRVKKATCRNYLRKHTKQLGFKQHICHHLLRRTFATYLIQRGANIKEVQYLCRHKSERTTLKAYVGVDKAKAKDVHRELLDKDF